MERISRTSQFRRDAKRMQRRGKDVDKLREVLQALLAGGRLPSRFRDHVLIGQYKGIRECHIEPDWLLVYELAQDEIVLIRTGSHSDLFE